jgi:DNA-binding NarL/FixJ family response regulator
MKKSEFDRYNALMPNRVREILLVSSHYDAFTLQEDGLLTEQILLEYKELSLSSSPQVTHVAHPAEALRMLQTCRYDLVLLVVRVADVRLIEFAKKIKELKPSLPVVVVGFDAHETNRLRSLTTRETIDAFFLWTGNATILLAIIKQIEDRLNLDNDIAVAGVQAILVVEDSLQYISVFLSEAYPQIMKQSQALYEEGLNRLQKLYWMRTRPKIIHAASYEEALALFHHYHEHLLAVITDVGLPSQGELDRQAGFRLVAEIRTVAPNLPVLIQSADEENAQLATRLDSSFVNKNSADLVKKIRNFFRDYLGFGPFIFRLPSGDEVARASDLHELAECIRTVPDASIEYHARHNHFSTWLLARSEYELATKLHPKQVDDFSTIADLRQFLLTELQVVRRIVRAGVVSDFSSQPFDPDSRFQRLGQGSLGGKARGIAFLNNVLALHTDDEKVEGLAVCIPQTFVVTTEFFDRFIRDNQLYRLDVQNLSDDQIARVFLEAHLPETLRIYLRIMLTHLCDPLAVRSSSLLEDDLLHPMAGIYSTLMIPNNDPDPERRLFQLAQAIQYIYASTFFGNARAYLENIGSRSEDEKMAVVIQGVVGNRYGRRFYPTFSGVAHSYNFYPLGPQTATDGVAQLVLGLGRMVMQGGASVRFCPRYPGVMPQFANPQLVLSNSQKTFYSLDLARVPVTDGTLALDDEVLFDLSAALQDGTIRLVGSVFDPQNQTITEGFGARGPWVVTFNNILKHQAIPLAPALNALLDLTTEAMGTPVELEFAGEMSTYGQPPVVGKTQRPPTLYLLQVRPILAQNTVPDEPPVVDPSQIICRSLHALGHGRHEQLYDLIYVKTPSFDAAHSVLIASELGVLNQQLAAEGRSSILIGPGRWGSADHWLGIPVQWSQISKAKIIVEAPPAGSTVEPSQGTHFFHNITSLRLGYLTIPPGAVLCDSPESEFVAWEWLDKQPALNETPYLRHIRFTEPLVAYLDGRTRIGVITKPKDLILTPVTNTHDVGTK